MNAMTCIGIHVLLAINKIILKKSLPILWEKFDFL